MRAVNSCSQLASSWPNCQRRQSGPQRRLLPPTHAASDVLPAARTLEQVGCSPRAQPQTPIVPPDPATPNPLLNASHALSAALEASSTSDGSQFPTGKDSPTFMESLRINTRVIQAESLSDLEQILYEELPAIQACDLGCVNLSTSFYHATRLWREAERLLRDTAREDGGDVRAQIRHGRSKHLEPVLVLLRPQLLSMPDRNIVQPYDLSISLWCMATLQLQDEQLFQALIGRIGTMVQRLKATDMAMTMWSCGRLRCGNTMLCGQLTVAAIGRVSEFKTCELSTFVWGMCHTGQQSPEILRAAARRMVERPGDFASEELVRLLWSFTRMRWREARHSDVHARIVAELARPERAAKLLPQDFSNTLWSLAQMKVYAEKPDLDALADAATANLHRFKEQELANLVYGYGAQRHWHEGLMTAAAAEVLLRKERFQDKELCMFLWAVGTLGVAPGGELFLTAVMKELHSRVKTLRPLSMSNAMKAFAKLRFLPPAEFMDSMSEVAVASLEEFNMSELSNLLWAYAQLGWTDEELFEASEEFMMDNMNLCTKHHVSSIANSFKTSGYLCHRLVTVARNNGFHV